MVLAIARSKLHDSLKTAMNYEPWLLYTWLFDY